MHIFWEYHLVRAQSRERDILELHDLWSAYHIHRNRGSYHNA